MGISILSKRENSIAERITRGYSEKEIANQLFISTATVHNHSYNIRKKLKARSAVDVAREYLLSLDNPKQFLTVVMLLGIQFHVMVITPDADLRKPVRTCMRIIKTKNK